jgi:hypothetical protein
MLFAHRKRILRLDRNSGDMMHNLAWIDFALIGDGDLAKRWVPRTTARPEDTGFSNSRPYASFVAAQDLWTIRKDRWLRTQSRSKHTPGFPLFIGEINGIFGI